MTHTFYNKKDMTGTGAIAQWSREMAVLAEDGKTQFSSQHSHDN